MIFWAIWSVPIAEATARGIRIRKLIQNKVNAIGIFLVAPFVSLPTYHRLDYSPTDKAYH